MTNSKTRIPQSKGEGFVDRVAEIQPDRAVGLWITN